MVKNYNDIWQKIKQHEIVIPTDPLPVWYFIFHDHNSEKYIAPHWHRGIELSYVEMVE